jgi:chromosome segregation ATPase
MTERTVRELEEALEHAETDYELLKDDYTQLLIDLDKANKKIAFLTIDIAGKDAVIKELENDVAFYKRYQTEKNEP